MIIAVVGGGGGEFIRAVNLLLVETGVRCLLRRSGKAGRSPRVQLLVCTDYAVLPFTNFTRLTVPTKTVGWLLLLCSVYCPWGQH